MLDRINRGAISYIATCSLASFLGCLEREHIRAADKTRMPRCPGRVHERVFGAREGVARGEVAGGWA